MEQRNLVIGVKRFKGNVDGIIYDNCKVRVLMPVSDGNNELGVNMVEINYGTSANFDQFTKWNFPVLCDLDVEFQLKNGRVTMSLMGIEPVK